MQDFFFVAMRIFNRSDFVTPLNTPGNNVFGPYDFNDTVVAIAIDPDLGDAGDDQIGFLPAPVNTMVWWDSDFDEPGFQFQPPGFGGVSYLKTPEDPETGEEVGLQNFTVFTNGGSRPDPSSRQEWYQGMTGDPDFVVFDVIPQDVRGMASSGQFPLPAGGFVEIYAAYFFAEAFGATPAELTTDNAIVNGEPIALFNNFVAAQAGVQAVFDAGFLVPTAPPSPAVELIPGDHQVTIVWDAAPVTAVDPFAKVALDPFLRDETGAPNPDAPGLGIFLEEDVVIFVPSLDVPGTTNAFITAGEAGLTGAEVTNPFFDPDFVIQDFEGFRVYRSETGNLDDAELIAQFDLVNDIVEGEFCIEGTTVPAVLEPGEEPFAVLCTESEFFPIGTNTGLAFGVTDRGGVFPNPANGPGLINGIPVYYAVTSFSVNCGVRPVTGLTDEFVGDLDIEAGCLTLESGKNLNPATPRSNASSFVAAGEAALNALQSDGSVCDVNEATATIDLSTGEYLDWINCSNAVVGANVAKFRDVNIPQAEVFFVVDSLEESPEHLYNGAYTLALGHRRVWFHWEDASGNLSSLVQPNVGFYDACYDFTVFCEDVVSFAVDTDASDVGPDASVDLIIASDFSAAEDLVVNGSSLALGDLGGTGTGGADGGPNGRALVVDGSSLGTRVVVGNPRAIANTRAYALAGPYAMGGESYELTWSVSGGTYTGTLRSLVSGNVIPEGGQPKGPANPSTPADFILGYNWGFIPPGDPTTVRETIGIGDVPGGTADEHDLADDGHDVRDPGARPGGLRGGDHGPSRRRRRVADHPHVGLGPGGGGEPGLRPLAEDVRASRTVHVRGHQHGVRGRDRSGPGGHLPGHRERLSRRQVASLPVGRVERAGERGPAGDRGGPEPVHRGERDHARRGPSADPVHEPSAAGDDPDLHHQRQPGADPGAWGWQWHGGMGCSDPLRPAGGERELLLPRDDTGRPHASGPLRGDQLTWRGRRVL